MGVNALYDYMNFIYDCLCHYCNNGITKFPDHYIQSNFALFFFIFFYQNDAHALFSIAFCVLHRYASIAFFLRYILVLVDCKIKSSAFEHEIYLNKSSAIFFSSWRLQYSTFLFFQTQQKSGLQLSVCVWVLLTFCTTMWPILHWLFVNAQKNDAIVKINGFSCSCGLANRVWVI